MLVKGFLKPKISIKNIGRVKFWQGIIIGILAAFILNSFLNYLRESFRLVTFMVEPYLLTEKEFRLYNLFYAAFSVSIGFGLTIIYWLKGRKSR